MFPEICSSIPASVVQPARDDGADAHHRFDHRRAINNVPDDRLFSRREVGDLVATEKSKVVMLKQKFASQASPTMPPAPVIRMVMVVSVALLRWSGLQEAVRRRMVKFERRRA